MKNSNIVFLGTEIKLNLHIDPIGDLTMTEYDFTVEVYCSSKKSLLINKSQAKPVENSNDDYIILIDTSEIGTGTLRCKVTAYIPDDYFEDNKRTEVYIIDTGIEIVKSI